MGDFLNFKGKKILVVDDEEINWLLMKDMFEDTGAIVSWARVGQEAIDFIDSGQLFNLILMDVKMPFLDGYETTRQIKQLNSSIPIIAFTALALPEEEQKCREAGCDDYLSKPVTIDEMFKTAARLIL